MPYIQLFSGLLMLSLIGPFVRAFGSQIPPEEIAAGRSIIVLLTLLSWRLVNGKSVCQLPIKKNRWQTFGAVCIAVNAVSAITAVALTSTATALLLTNSAPIYQCLYVRMFEKRNPTREEWTILFGSSACLVVFLWNGLEGGFLGTVAGVVGGFTWTGYIYAQTQLGKSGKMSSSGEPLTVGTLLLGNCIGAVVLGVTTLLGPGFTMPTERSFTLLTGMGVFQSAIPALLWAAALPKVEPIARGLAPSLIAVISPLLTLWWMGEPFPGRVEAFAAIALHVLVAWSVLKPILAARRELRTS